MRRIFTFQQALFLRHLFFSTLFLLGFLVFACIAANAQSPAVSVPSVEATPVAPLKVATEVQLDRAEDFLKRGKAFEAVGDWTKALCQYEEGLRYFPDEQSLIYRFRIARLQNDLKRRLDDSSFVKNRSQMSFGESMRLYGETLQRLETHYVDKPDWKMVVRHGGEAMDIALANNNYLSAFQKKSNAPMVLAVRRELARYINAAQVHTASDARAVVQKFASYAKKYLGIFEQAVVTEFLCGGICSLDHYSAFLTQDQLNEVYDNIDGNFVGLGVELKMADGYLTIIRVLANSPARESGLVAGDQIIFVDGVTTKEKSIDLAANLLRGLEGSTANLVVRTPGKPDRRVPVRRRRVDIVSIENTQMLDPRLGIGYFRLSCFQKTTLQEMRQALNYLEQQGMKCLVIDLRGNPGGLLGAAVDAVDLFVQRGVIVSTKGRNAFDQQTYFAKSGNEHLAKLVVLIDRDSASAAEIFAAAIHELNRGIVVGEQSFGKGSVQGIFPIVGTKSGLRLTTAKFFSPKDHPISHVGVKPTVVVTKVAKPQAIESAAGNPVAAPLTPAYTSVKIPGYEGIDLQKDDILRAGVVAARRQVQMSAIWSPRKNWVQ